MTEDNISCSTAIEESVAHASWRNLSVHNYIKMLIIGGLFYYIFHNEIGRIVHRWLADPSWSHGFLIPLFSLYFINQNKTEILSLQARPNYLGLFFLICGILFYPFNIVQLRYAYLQPIGMVATLGAIVLFLGGWRLIRYTWLPIVYLIFAIPLPHSYYIRITMPMRQWASVVSAVLLDLVRGVEATAHGVIIDIVYHGKAIESLNVADACSGMRLLMAFVALGVAMAYLHYRPIWQKLVLLASTIPIAIFCNIVRVTITGFIYVMGNPKYAKGIWHDTLGMVMLLLAFGLYGFLAWFMSSLFVDQSQEAMENIVVRKRRE